MSTIANPILLEHPSVAVGTKTSVDIIYWIYAYGTHLIEILAVHDLTTFPIKSSGRLIYDRFTVILPGATLTLKSYRNPITKLVDRVTQSTKTLKYIYQRYKASYYVSFEFNYCL